MSACRLVRFYSSGIMTPFKYVICARPKEFTPCRSLPIGDLPPPRSIESRLGGLQLAGKDGEFGAEKRLGSSVASWERWEVRG